MTLGELTSELCTRFSIVGVGVDIVEISRIERIAARNEEAFLRRILGDAEREHNAVCRRTPFRWTWYAQCVAAKESFFKAIGSGLVRQMRWRDVQVKISGTHPAMIVAGEPESVLACCGVSGIWLSLGYTKRHAVALVILTSSGRAKG